ncbi:MAG TPA: TetR/AcrR family transcriptional regulator [Egibacteraceae bacterium]|nr:TetR/AcrR family transcriptional regulator [Egibacteraceae bacterium]
MTEQRLAADEAARSRGERTAQRLREAAREAFAELGWQATRVEDIVKRAGVSHGTFYTYYENKTAVLAALVRDSEAAFSALAAAPWKADDVRGALERVIGGFLERYRADAVIMRTWLQAARDERGFSSLYVESRALFVDRVAEHVAAAVAASGRDAVPPARTVASSLVAMVEHFAYCWLVLGEEHAAADVVDSLVLVWGSTLNALAGFEVVDLAPSGSPGGG